MEQIFGFGFKIKIKVKSFYNNLTHHLPRLIDFFFGGGPPYCTYMIFATNRIWIKRNQEGFLFTVQIES